jgi:hypothetical protein
MREGYHKSNRGVDILFHYHLDDNESPFEEVSNKILNMGYATINGFEYALIERVLIGENRHFGGFNDGRAVNYILKKGKDLTMDETDDVIPA